MTETAGTTGQENRVMDFADDEVIIGLEIHCQLDTLTKLFCGCSTDYRNDPPTPMSAPPAWGCPVPSLP